MQCLLCCHTVRRLATVETEDWNSLLDTAQTKTRHQNYLHNALRSTSILVVTKKKKDIKNQFNYSTNSKQYHNKVDLRLYVCKAFLNLDKIITQATPSSGWWRSTVVERRSLTGELSLSCARPAADGWPLMWVNHPLQVSQLGQLSLSSFRGR